MENQTQSTAKKYELEASVNLLNNKLHFLGKAGENEPVHLDYTAPIGDNLGYMPLQIFLMSLAACAGGSVLYLLRREGKIITGLDVRATGTRRMTHPTSFSKIVLDFEIKSDGLTDMVMQKAISDSEETYCPIWAMIKNNVEVVSNFKIIK